MGRRARGVAGRLDRRPADLRSRRPRLSVTARPGNYSRHRPPQTVTGTGDSETAALRALDDRLRGVPQPNGSRMAERERRIRMAYLGGAEEWSRKTLGRGLTEGELEGVVRRFR